MLSRPSRSDLLEAIAAFLASDLKDAISDPRLAFRVLVAANLCRSVAGESRQSESEERAEIERLRALLPGAAGDLAPTSSSEARAALIGELNRRLITQIKDRDLAPDQRQRISAHLEQTLRAELKAANPRFDLSPDIE